MSWRGSQIRKRKQEKVEDNLLMREIGAVGDKSRMSNERKVSG